jgi:hypothetical protein
MPEQNWLQLLTCYLKMPMEKFTAFRATKLNTKGWFVSVGISRWLLVPPHSIPGSYSRGWWLPSESDWGATWGPTLLLWTFMLNINDLIMPRIALEANKGITWFCKNISLWTIGKQSQIKAILPFRYHLLKKQILISKLTIAATAVVNNSF